MNEPSRSERPEGSGVAESKVSAFLFGLVLVAVIAKALGFWVQWCVGVMGTGVAIVVTVKLWRLQSELEPGPRRMARCLIVLMAALFLYLFWSALF